MILGPRRAAAHVTAVIEPFLEMVDAVGQKLRGNATDALLRSDFPADVFYPPWRPEDVTCAGVVGHAQRGNLEDAKREHPTLAYCMDEWDTALACFKESPSREKAWALERERRHLEIALRSARDRCHLAMTHEEGK